MSRKCFLLLHLAAECLLGFQESVAAVWTGWLDVPATGPYTFSLSSDDGSRLYLDGSTTPLIDNGGASGGMSQGYVMCGVMLPLQHGQCPEKAMKGR